MLRSAEKHAIRRLIFGKVSLIILLVVCAIFARGTWGVYQKSAYAKENRERAEQELEELNERETALVEELARLDTPRGLEEEIRQKFDVGRDGEHMIVLVDAPESVVPPVPVELTVWQKIVRFFGF